MSALAPITWETSPATGPVIHGYLTTKRGTPVRVFTIGVSRIPGKRYVLRSMLPGFNRRDGYPAVSAASAKSLARMIQANYVEMLTGE